MPNKINFFNSTINKVFNNGFQNILGAVDADQLLAQHIGGGFVANAGNAGPQNVNEGGHRHERHMHVEHGRIEEPRREQEEEGQAQIMAQRQPRQGQGRLSNKKRRRKQNIQQRREIQQQRQAAAAMGFGENGLNQPRDQIAMNRLIEDQVQ